MALSSNQWSVLSALARRQPSTRDEIIGFQNERLRLLLRHAYERVPYYRQLFDRHGIAPQDIRDVRDLHALPITTKTDLRSRPDDEVIADNVDPASLVSYTTSGSSGTPFTIRRTLHEDRYLTTHRFHVMRSRGLRITDKEASVRIVRPARIPLSVRVLRRLGLFRLEWVECRLPIHDIMRTLDQYRPDVLTGYPGVLFRLAQAMDDDSRVTLRPRFIVAGGEVLTAAMRRYIAEAFHAPVFDDYGSFEFNLLASECGETGELHVCEDGVILEVLTDGRPAHPGERGEVVCTNLHAFAMPLIRYRLGDIVTMGTETCRCGSPYSTIRAVQGRMIDYFLLPGNRLLHPYAVGTILTGMTPSWIGQFQITQELQNRLTIQIVPLGTPRRPQIEALRASLAELLGSDVECRIDLVPDIRFDASGKFRVHRSLVYSAYDGLEWAPLGPVERVDRPKTGIQSPVVSH
jgi:phenylacetate-CoA ligase